MGARRNVLFAVMMAAARPAGAQARRPVRCAAEPAGAACEARTPSARPRYEAPLSVLERRAPPRQSREALLAEVRARGERDGDALGPLTAGLTPAARADHLGRLVEDYTDIAALSDAEAGSLEPSLTDPAQAGVVRPRREALRRDARQYREQVVRTVQHVVETAPTAPNLDRLLFRMAAAQVALSREDEALRAYRALIQRFPRSPYVPHAFLAFAEHFFAERVWESAAQFYERAALPAEPVNQARAYALYRLGWTRLLLGDPAAARARFDEALAWATAHPDAPDVARVAEAARADREVAAWAAAPTRAVPDAADVDALAQAAGLVHAAGDWRASLALHRQLLARRSLDARYCAWRAAAAQATSCLARRPAAR